MEQNRDRESDFETLRQAAMRCFEVTFMDGTKERVFAHFHDGGNGKLLNFVVISPDGHQMIREAYNLDVVKRLREIMNDRIEDATTRFARATHERHTKRAEPPAAGSGKAPKKKVFPVIQSRKDVH